MLDLFLSKNIAQLYKDQINNAPDYDDPLFLVKKNL